MFTGTLTSMNNNGSKGTVFLGVVNLAIAHVSIVYNRAHAAANKPKSSHVDSLTCTWSGVSSENVTRPSFSVQTTKNCPIEASLGGIFDAHASQKEVNRKPNKDCSRKSRQRVCKVCWLLKDVVTGGDTSFRCSACVLTTYNKKIGAIKPSQVYLCNKLKHAFNICHKC
ncbi:LOW QUALITY PROTEIN: Hypothetical protein PHPALM_7404 [Phytophthora palmivora]|uniref:Uncharacterized protein n=1 Tax=Phytophthora palmivora TaxID=4796 RepID=A0A2P4YCS6_9STRA|nr:LOW QUALITY PROTEIN: Hypothetical protein PHPALM_7404 [Phytophthora palmivora]